MSSLVYSDTDPVWRNQYVISKELTHSIGGPIPTLDLQQSCWCEELHRRHLVSLFACLSAVEVNECGGEQTLGCTDTVRLDSVTMAQFRNEA